MPSRVTTRLISAVAAALLAVAAGVALIELALAAFERTPWIVDWRSLETFGQDHSWDDAAVRLIAIALLAAGVVLLVAALRPRPPVSLDSRLGSDLTTVTIRRRPLEALVADTARSVHGTTEATARWNGRGMDVHVVTSRTAPADIEGVVGGRVDAVLAAWRVEGEPTRVRVTSGSPSPAQLPPPPPPASPMADWPPAEPSSRPEEVLR